MKLAIMQPYFFPYIGYYQLVNVVDKFVFLDDVNYIRRGWVNRNRVLIFGEEKYITVPVLYAEVNAKIHDIKISNDLDWRRKILQQLAHSYKKAPYYKQSLNLIERVIYSSDESLSDVAKSSIESVFNYLGLHQDFQSSSAVGVTANKGQARIIDICKKERAEVYINAPGGRGLYHPLAFSENAIELRFLNVDVSDYPQFSDNFYPGLSMMDVMMFNSPNAIRQMLDAASA